MRFSSVILISVLIACFVQPATAKGPPAVATVQCTNPPNATHFVPWVQLQSTTTSATTTVIDEWRAWLNRSPIASSVLRVNLDDPQHAVWGQKYLLATGHGANLSYGTDFIVENSKGIAPPATRVIIANPAVADTLEIYGYGGSSGGQVIGNLAGGDVMFFAVSAFAPDVASVQVRAGIDIRSDWSPNTYVTGCNGAWVKLTH